MGKENKQKRDEQAAKEGGDDMLNYKGIYFNDDVGQKYSDPDNGAHFEYKDMCKRLQKVMQKREEYFKFMEF